MTEVLATVLVASLLGSLHCIGMCGGFVAFYSGGAGAADAGRPSPLPHVAYNLGRLTTYVALGALAGAVGASLDGVGELSGARDVAALVAGTLIVVWGAVLLLRASGATWAKTPGPRWLSGLLGRVLPRLGDRPPVVRALVLGMASTLLPCGWLYGFAASAAGTGHPLSGALVMAVFWLGTVPAMVFAGAGIRFAARHLGPRLGVLMPALLILVGLFTLAGRGFPEVGAPTGAAAPETVEEVAS